MTELIDFTNLTGVNLPDGLFDEAGFGTLIIDPIADRVVLASVPCGRFFGLALDILIDKRPSALFRSALADLHVLTEACLVGPGSWQSSFRLQTAKGQTLEVDCHAARYRIENLTLLALLLFDVRKQRKRLARADFDALYRSDPGAIRQADQMFRDLQRGNKLILDAAGEGIYGVNKQGETTFVNPAAERMLGWNASEIVGKIAHDVIHHTHPCGKDYPIHECPIYLAFRDGQIHEVRGEVFWRKDGSSFPVEYTSTPIEDDGKLVGAVVVFRDISKQLEQENKLRQALDENEQLRARLEMEKAYLLDELEERHNRHEIVGCSPAVAQIVEQIDLVAPTQATVLITGESGTGKELIARAIHNASPRRDRPLIRVNCAAIPAELFESEFFGHIKGAFTGAVSARAGRFELADGGTLFLDEVGELPLEQQGKLLRVLQEQQFERVGDAKTIRVDVRVIAATNRELRHSIMEKHFREDLYFRLAVFPVHSAPLRERREDIPPLANLFLRRVTERLNRSVEPQLTVAHITQLQAYDWPGNIRELENVIERAVILSRNGPLHFDLPQKAGAPGRAEWLNEGGFGEAAAPLPLDHSGAHSGSVSTSPKSLTKTPSSRASLDEQPTDQSQSLTSRAELQRLEIAAIHGALTQSGGKVSGAGGAAERLGMKPTTLYSRLKRLEIDARRFKK